MNSKTCFKCKRTQKTDAFQKDRQKKDGYRSVCKGCLKSLNFKPNYRRHKICAGCKIKKNGKQFRKARMRPDGLQAYCNVCQDGRNRARKYGISQEIYYELIKRQENKCKICGKQELFRALAVDHNKYTGQVRGLLCYKCNIGIGF